MMVAKYKNLPFPSCDGTRENLEIYDQEQGCSSCCYVQVAAAEGDGDDDDDGYDYAPAA